MALKFHPQTNGTSKKPEKTLTPSAPLHRVVHSVGVCQGPGKVWVLHVGAVLGDGPAAGEGEHAADAKTDKQGGICFFSWQES